VQEVGQHCCIAAASQVAATRPHRRLWHHSIQATIKSAAQTTRCSTTQHANANASSALPTRGSTS
jgi:hypothetical protein